MTARLELREVWKAYPRYGDRPRTLRERLRRPAPLLTRGRETRWALRDVSLSLGAGESLGIVGHNGAGKSTLLRLAAGLGLPTRGGVSAPRDSASVLSLGAWFDHELSGRENAETAAVVLGLNWRQARAAVPAALEFAGLERFADAPVRTYSDGMRLRLAFGVLAQLTPALLLIDEALAVGDAAFQIVCLRRIAEMRAAGTALLFASHDLDQVIAECDRAIWLHRGEVRFAGDAAEAVAAYRESGRRETLARTPGGEEGLGEERWGSQELRVENAALLGPDGRAAAEVAAGSTISVELELHPGAAPVEDPHVVVELKRAEDDLLCVEASTDAAGLRLGRIEAPVRLALELERLPLAAGDYIVCAGAYPRDWEYAFDYRYRLLRLRLSGPTAKGVVTVPPRWRVV